ncbi:MAG: ABC transporter permease [Spirochaetales bacterium]|nr:ABC transporter permease [Spirochaetales bacterium]
MKSSGTKPSTSKIRKFFKRLFARKIVIFGAVLVVVFVLAALLAPYISPHDPYKQNLKLSFAKPSAQHVLGNDELGRDIFSRIIYGARTSLAIGFVAVMIAAGCGILLGLVAGYLGGMVNSVISRVMDALMSIPAIMLSLGLGIIFGAGMTSLMIILGLATVPTYTRLMSAQVLAIRNSDFINAERVLGASNIRIMFSHILPNCLSPIIVLFTMNIGGTILAEASLSFLGLGVKAPMASWGAMVNEGYSRLITNPVFALAPGICIMLLVLGFNILGDGLRDVLDPRLRGSI